MNDLGIRAIIIFAIAMLTFVVASLVLVSVIEHRATIRFVESLNRGGMP